jgi:hypothetical protein
MGVHGDDGARGTLDGVGELVGELGDGGAFGGHGDLPSG